MNTLTVVVPSNHWKLNDEGEYEIPNPMANLDYKPMKQYDCEIKLILSPTLSTNTQDDEYDIPYDTSNGSIYNYQTVQFFTKNNNLNMFSWIQNYKHWIAKGGGSSFNRILSGWNIWNSCFGFSQNLNVHNSNNSFKPFSICTGFLTDRKTCLRSCYNPPYLLQNSVWPDGLTLNQSLYMRQDNVAQTDIYLPQSDLFYMGYLNGEGFIKVSITQTNLPKIIIRVRGYNNQLVLLPEEIFFLPIPINNCIDVSMNGMDAVGIATDVQLASQRILNEIHSYFIYVEFSKQQIMVDLMRIDNNTGINTSVCSGIFNLVNHIEYANINSQGPFYLYGQHCQYYKTNQNSETWNIPNPGNYTAATNTHQLRNDLFNPNSPIILTKVSIFPYHVENHTNAIYFTNQELFDTTGQYPLHHARFDNIQMPTITTQHLRIGVGVPRYQNEIRIAEIIGNRHINKTDNNNTFATNIDLIDQNIPQLLIAGANLLKPRATRLTFYNSVANQNIYTVRNNFHGLNELPNFQGFGQISDFTLTTFFIFNSLYSSNAVTQTNRSNSLTNCVNSEVNGPTYTTVIKNDNFLNTDANIDSYMFFDLTFTTAVTINGFSISNRSDTDNLRNRYFEVSIPTSVNDLGNNNFFFNGLPNGPNKENALIWFDKVNMVTTYSNLTSTNAANTNQILAFPFFPLYNSYTRSGTASNVVVTSTAEPPMTHAYLPIKMITLNILSNYYLTKKVIAVIRKNISRIGPSREIFMSDIFEARFTVKAPEVAEKWKIKIYPLTNSPYLITPPPPSVTMVTLTETPATRLSGVKRKTNFT